MKQTNTDYRDTIKANIELHSAMADLYNQVEPHFRPESIKRVTGIVNQIGTENQIHNALDLGCGTGFMINILKNYAINIVGVDVTQSMLDKVDMSGNSKITLINGDTGSVDLPENYFDIATAYTFLDHLHDMKPTFINCYNSLKHGGVFYADLSPNAYFWDEIKKLSRLQYILDPIILREINAVTKKDEEIKQEFGISKEIFFKAEFQKHMEGGLREEKLAKELYDIGFKEVKFIYHWFLGQAQMINDNAEDKIERYRHADIMHKYLIKSMPLSRHLFKYIGFIAKK